MGGTWRFVSLLASPFPTLLTQHLRRPSLLYCRLLTTTACRRRLTVYNHTNLSPISPIKSSQPQHQQYHAAKPIDNSSALNSHPWPELSNLISVLTGSHHLVAPAAEDSFVAYEELSDEFARAAVVCLAFAREHPNLIGLLSRRDIEVVVSNGTPFLFKAALDSARRMRAFLGIGGNTVLDCDKASTVDLMKYILSYSSKPTVSSEKKALYSRELIETSCRNLLHELVEASRGAPAVTLPLQGQFQFSGEYGQTPRPIRQNIVMKRGDWICQKCNFMNFARNSKCLECEEPRPRRQLTGGEWECSQCNFFNYGRNMICLRCDFRRPAEASHRAAHSNWGTGHCVDSAYPNGFDPRLAENKQNMNQILGQSSFSSGTSHKGIAADGNAETVINRSSKSSNHVPFTPLPTDMFDKKNPTSIMDEKVAGEIGLSHTPEASQRASSVTGGNDFWKSTEEPKSNCSVSEDQEREQAEKSESWFKKIAELHDIKDLPTATSDDDFPEIMPMHKGDNRFVISKKKDRSLTSPMYKRQVAMEQASNNNFVPFVPFPPGYFAKKGTKQADVADSSSVSKVETSSISQNSDNEGSRSDPVSTTYSKMVNVERIHQKSDDHGHNISNVNAAQIPDDQFTNSGYFSNFPGDQGHHVGNSVETSLASDASSTDRSPCRNSVKGDVLPSENLRVGSPQLPGIKNVVNGWTGKSLEGSAVKEPDPLDMSEEAKAERWFRRVAQIKDISELSQIPDEDFPSIMPMRKGVNRFVVSKRKTPLERRLTSTQYRRNLPVVSSDSMKIKSDNCDVK